MGCKESIKVFEDNICQKLGLKKTNFFLNWKCNERKNVGLRMEAAIRKIFFVAFQASLISDFWSSIFIEVRLEE